MSTHKQLDVDVYRILLYRSDATELLLGRSPAGFRLPEIAIPPHTRAAEEITAAIKRSWKLETICLFFVGRNGPSESPRYQVAEVCRLDAGAFTGARWLPVPSLLADSFEYATDFSAIAESLKWFDQYRRGELPGPFGKPGWLSEVTEWVETQAAPVGLKLTGKFRQFNASPTFSLIRFETDGAGLWFKAVGEPNLHEYPITLKLSTAFPEFLPHVLGARPEWNAWLAIEAEGSPLSSNSPDTAWAAVTESLGRLQIATLGRRFELIEAGCKDLRPCRLLEVVDPFFDTMSQLMETQTKPSPAPLSRKEFSTLGQEIRAGLQELESDGLPNALGHLDMNPCNVLISNSRGVFLDWAEAYIGPPFFTVQYLMEHHRRLRHEECKKESLDRYWKFWDSRFSQKQVRTSVRLTPLLAVFAYAVSISAWRSPQTIAAESAAYLRSWARRMKREAGLLEEARQICTP
jgi:hypothetical protein